MRMAAVFGLNQVVSHGFGVFLFAALLPLMRESIAISNWQLASIGALTQLSYLAGALLLGLIGHRIGTVRLALVTTSLTTGLLFLMSQLRDPLHITLALVILAASASISWGTIVEIISRYANKASCSTTMSCASSGTAWGYGINGLLILLVVPHLGWESGWVIAGGVGVLALILSWNLLRGLAPAGVASFDTDAANVISVAGAEAIPARQLLAVILRERTAFFACLICCLVGFSAMPFSAWLNLYLDERGLPAALGGYTWTVVGITGMIAGLLIGKLADHKGHGTAFTVIFSGFALGLLAFMFDPARWALLAGFGYGLMYFPMWGIVAGWVSQHYGSTATMQINGVCMVTFGMGGTLGNLLAGYLREATGSLSLMYDILTVTALLLVALGLFIRHTGKGAAVTEGVIPPLSDAA
ncbi:MFS transporter [Marinobacterium rhizophilum]|uniref:MFS transporter n=1 Tax=Marinobacterium rhizophilum TaxID=420402 RepID=A0ABY5HFN1_9GAMM|nr:MFS transporter [Marinobacterium rhizophilum]UTW10929.1 MFS transporter [Marinobacterium rhizophilum]